MKIKMLYTLNLIVDCRGCCRAISTPPPFFIWHTAPPPPSGPGPPHSRSFYITHNDVPQAVGFLWTSDQPVAGTSTWQHTTFTRDRHPRPRWVSNPQFQHASGRRLAPYTARALGSANFNALQLEDWNIRRRQLEKRKWKYVPFNVPLISERPLVFERFSGFALILPVTAKEMKMRMGYWCNDIQGATTILGRKPDLVTLSSGQMSHELTWDWNRASAKKDPTKDLSHSTVLNLEINTDNT